MPTFIKSGFWESLCIPCKGYKGWLNLDELIKSIAQLFPGPQGPMGPQGPEGTLEGNYYGTFLSLERQSDGTAVHQMYYEETYLSNGISITDDDNGDPTNITFDYNGVYNIQFSAQLRNLGGGGNSAHMNIWLMIDGENALYSNTRVSVTANNPYAVAAWNWFLPVTAGQKVQIAWQSNHEDVVIEAETEGVGQPGIPSIILTVNRIA